MSETTDSLITEEQRPLDPPPTEPQPEQQPPEDKAELRIRRLTARYVATARERDELAHRLANLQSQPLPGQQQAQPPLDPALQDLIREEAKKLAAAERAQERKDAFHAAGNEQFPDWEQRCLDLQAMGADHEIARLLVETLDSPKEAARIAGALRDAPEEIERIAGIRGERGRAIALGQFVAKLEAEPVRNRTRAPRPPAPIQGRVAPVFNEQEASTAQLVEYYRKQELQKRGAA